MTGRILGRVHATRPCSRAPARVQRAAGTVRDGGRSHRPANQLEMADDVVDERLSADLWVASCRPASGRGQLKTFAARTTINQPPTDRFFCHCAKDPRQCKMFVLWQQRQANGECHEGVAIDRVAQHCMFYTHEMLPRDDTPTAVENQPTLGLTIPTVRLAWVLPSLDATERDGFVAPQVLQPGRDARSPSCSIRTRLETELPAHIANGRSHETEAGGRPAPARTDEPAVAAGDTTDPHASSCSHGRPDTRNLAMPKHEPMP